MHAWNLAIQEQIYFALHLQDSLKNETMTLQDYGPHISDGPFISRNSCEQMSTVSLLHADSELFLATPTISVALRMHVTNTSSAHGIRMIISCLF